MCGEKLSVEADLVIIQQRELVFLQCQMIHTWPILTLQYAK